MALIDINWKLIFQIMHLIGNIFSRNFVILKIALKFILK